MSFQIHNPKGKAIDINELDKQAAEFWGTEISKKHYAHPNLEGYFTNSWFDSIGWAIHSPEGYSKGWNDVKCTLWTIQARSFYAFLHTTEELYEQLETTRTFLAPYFNLINHWESKGYIPVQIKD